MQAKLNAQQQLKDEMKKLDYNLGQLADAIAGLEGGEGGVWSGRGLGEVENGASDSSRSTGGWITVSEVWV